ncbi:MAG: cardiolipin synthase [Clostridia bacterium]|nr:cardiolipin synthase [Clostridia bacterium]
MKKKAYEIRHKEAKRYAHNIPPRYLIALAIMILKLILIIGVITTITVIVPYFYVLTVITQIVCVIRIISSDDNPDYKAPWLLVVLLLPIAGYTLYLLFYSRQLGHTHRKRLKEISKFNYKKDDDLAFERLKKEDKDAHNMAKMLCDISQTHLFENVKQQYFSSGEEAFPYILEDLKKAEKFIYLEFFIIESGKFWDCVLDILKQKAKEGLDVKVLFDDIGCMRTLPPDYERKLKKFGIQGLTFSKMRASTNNEFNNRNHRKMIIIDGKVGYTGGINIADEYINERNRFGYWKDNCIRLEGECVWEFIELFLMDYAINSKSLPQRRNDFYPTANFSQEGYVIPFGDGPKPMYERKVAMNTIQTMIDSSKDYFWVMTPYLVPDNDTCASLEKAALKGVDVRIILPHIPDKKIVFGITRSYYNRLINAGVKIYEYKPGFVHAKNYLSDGKTAIVGSVNLDYRSLAHNFENGVWMYKTEVIADIKADFDKTLEDCIQIDKSMIKISKLRQLLRGIVRIFAPLL